MADDRLFEKFEAPRDLANGSFPRPSTAVPRTDSPNRSGCRRRFCPALAASQKTLRVVVHQLDPLGFLGDGRLLIVATNRIGAFDWVLLDPRQKSSLRLLERLPVKPARQDHDV